jgi:hypothetical protein
MDNVVEFKDQKYTWQDIPGKGRSLVPYIDPGRNRVLRIGCFIRLNKTSGLYQLIQIPPCGSAQYVLTYMSQEGMGCCFSWTIYSSLRKVEEVLNHHPDWTIVSHKDALK